jgi:hypothetical protein
VIGRRPGLFYGGVAALGGLVLAESLFLPWYGVDVTVAGAEVGSRPSAWQAMSGKDVLLFLTAMIAVGGGLAVLRRPELSPIPLAAGVAATLLCLLALIDLPEPGVAALPGDTAGVGREIGGFVGLVAAAGIAFAGYAAGTLRAEAGPVRRRAGRA